MTNRQKRVVLFGELLMRLGTPLHERFVQAQNFEVSYTGGEANTGALLARLGVEGLLVAAVPDNDIGQACLNYMRRYGLNTTNVQRRGRRLGTLYLETGAAQRPSKVIYDRAGSSFADLKLGDVDWNSVLRGADWLHFTGTAPALSEQLAALTLEGCQIAQSLGVTVSCDLNYRRSLWTIEEAQATIARIIPHVDVLIANEEHARELLGAPAADLTEPTAIFEPGPYRQSTNWLRKQYGFRAVALTMRSGTAADETKFAGLLDDGRSVTISRAYNIRVVDRIGAGDAFAAGLIFGMLEDWQPVRTVQFAAAAACLKHTIHGDFCLVSLEEIRDLAEYGPSGKVLR
jgi:2-dehydro-3-deoxygluconokinase